MTEQTNLLFVNKNQSLVNDLKKIVSNIFVCNSLEEALDTFFSKKINFVITDIDYSSNSINNIELFKAAKKNIPIIILTENKLDANILKKIVNLDIKGLFSFAEKDLFFQKFFICLNDSKEHDKNKTFLTLLNTVMDSQKDIIFSIENEDIIYANKRFYEFFQVDSISSFHKKFISLQSLILKEPLSEIYLDKPLTTLLFIEHLYLFKEDKRTIALKDNEKGEVKIFLIKISFIKEGYRLFNLVDITNIAKKHSLLEERAHFDQLTHLYNRHKFNELISPIDLQYNRKYSLLMIDIDHFKKINDSLGHDVGDKTLKELAFLLKALVRKTDILARWGGEEFILLLRDSNYEDGLIFAERIRQAISNHIFSIQNITISIGVSHSSLGNNIDAVRYQADQALYLAKDEGRNQSVGFLSCN